MEIGEPTLDEAGVSIVVEGEDGEDLLGGDGVFTGFKMQRLTCLLRLEATPKRRPQVSHTNAISRSEREKEEEEDQQ